MRCSPLESVPVDPGNHNPPLATRDAALARVLACRERGRARPMPIRATLAVALVWLLVDEL